MTFQKSINFPFPFNAVQFFVLEEVLAKTGEERIFRHNLYMADERAEGGLRLIAKSAAYQSDGVQYIALDLDDVAEQCRSERTE